MSRLGPERQRALPCLSYLCSGSLEQVLLINLTLQNMQGRQESQAKQARSDHSAGLKEGSRKSTSSQDEQGVPPGPHDTTPQEPASFSSHPQAINSPLCPFPPSHHFFRLPMSDHDFFTLSWHRAGLRALVSVFKVKLSGREWS